MQNILDICKEFGLEIPADKQSDFNKKVAENYVTKAEHDKKLNRAESDRDTWKEKAETAEATLKGFEGKDLNAMQKEIEDWKEKATKAESEYNEKMAEHEKQELLKEAFADIEFTSESAKKAIMAQVAEGVSVKNGKLIGFNDLLEDARKNDASAFVNKEQQNLEQNKARFTTPMNNQNGNSNGTLTKKDIMAIKDPVERQQKIAENMSLFQK